MSSLLYCLSPLTLSPAIWLFFRLTMLGSLLDIPFSILAAWWMPTLFSRPGSKVNFFGKLSLELRKTSLQHFWSLNFFSFIALSHNTVIYLFAWLLILPSKTKSLLRAELCIIHLCIFSISRTMFGHSCCCSVSKSCLTLWDPMDCSVPGFPVLLYFLEFAQTHVHWVGDAIQLSHPQLPPSPPALNLS